MGKKDNRAVYEYIVEASMPMILAGPAIGIPITLYLGYLIPISLACFVAMQILRLAIKSD